MFTSRHSLTLLSIGVFFLTLFSGNHYLKTRVAATYLSISTNQEIRSAFTSNPKEVAQVAQKYGLNYQRIENSKVVESSTNLPIPSIVTVSTHMAPGVLAGNLVDEQSTLLPYSKMWNYHIYAVIPYLDLGRGYLVYAPI